MTSPPPASTGLQSVNHIVVLMLENRSFDHMLWFLYSSQGNVSPTGAAFEGVDRPGKQPRPEWQPGNGKRGHERDTNLYYSPGAGPGEGYLATNAQLFGNSRPSAQPTNSGYVSNYADTLAWEPKDPSWRVLPGTVDANIMTMFTPATLAVLSGLARGFAVTKTFTSPSIFGLLADHGISWMIYGYDSPPLTRQAFTDITD